MESNTITPLDLQSEYYRILAALRIAATVAILFAAWWLYAGYSFVTSSVEVFENMVTGGVDALPSLTKLVLNQAHLCAAVGGLTIFAGLGGVWLSRCRISGLIYFCLLGTAPAFLLSILFHLTVSRSLHTVFTRFAA